MKHVVEWQQKLWSAAAGQAQEQQAPACDHFAEPDIQGQHWFS
jgi:hypothetical protein